MRSILHCMVNGPTCLHVSVLVKRSLVTTVYKWLMIPCLRASVDGWWSCVCGGGGGGVIIFLMVIIF
jgi:hypothetical protein